MEKEQYQIEFSEFIANYRRGQTSSDEVGELIVRLAQYFSEWNMKATTCETSLSQKAVEIVQSTEDSKQISVARADILIKATQEAEALRLAKAHLTNVEVFLNSCKYLQRALTQEMNYAGA